MNDTLQALAEQYIVMGADVPYHDVVGQVALTMSLTPMLNAPEIMSNLEWAECRELVLHGLRNRTLTRQEAADKARQDRIKAEQERRLRVGKQFADSCEAQGGYVDKWSSYLSGHVDQPECKGLEAARERARKKQECLRGGGVWKRVSKTVGAHRCGCAVAGSTWNPSLKRCETYDARHERQARAHCREVQGTWDPSHKRYGPCITPKERRLEEWDRQQAEEGERVRRERERAKAEKRRKLEERRRQLSGG
ncbi:MAG: hypothetical protein OXI73_16145 [Rhodospirillales bacterium]|nr:hypothetical protein [Rhodospirillales bacterium]